MSIPKPPDFVMLSKAERLPAPVSTPVQRFCWDEETFTGLIQKSIPLEDGGDRSVCTHMVELRRYFCEQSLEPPYRPFTSYHVGHLTIISNTRNATVLSRLIRQEERLKDWMIDSLWEVDSNAGHPRIYGGLTEEF